MGRSLSAPYEIAWPDRSAKEAVLNSCAERERAMLIEDIRKNPPTAVLADNLTGRLGRVAARAPPDVADLLKNYRLAETVNGIGLSDDSPPSRRDRAIAPAFPSMPAFKVSAAGFRRAPRGNAETLSAIGRAARWR
jgi:hypothetical protein